MMDKIYFMYNVHYSKQKISIHLCLEGSYFYLHNIIIILQKSILSKSKNYFIDCSMY